MIVAGVGCSGVFKRLRGAMTVCPCHIKAADQRIITLRMTAMHMIVRVCKISAPQGISGIRIIGIGKPQCNAGVSHFAAGDGLTQFITF